MRLLSLNVSDFGSLHERTFTFGPGMNLVVGRNEAGKSTLLHCLAQTLMGKPSRYGAFPDVQPWGVSDRNSFMATLEVEHAEQRYRITRRFAERGAKAVTLARLDANDAVSVITQDPRDVARWLGDVFGVSDDTIFYKVFCLSQADLSPLKDNADLYEQLERAISGAEVATAAAVSAIDERLRLLRRGVGERGAKANWGPLQTAIAGRQEAEAKLAEARQADAQLTSARETLATVDARVIEIRERIATLEALMASTRECRELRKRYEDLKAIFDGIEQQRAKVEATITRRDQLREELEKLALAEADPVSLRTALARASAVQSEADRLGTERSALQGRLHALPAPYLDTLALRASLQAVERGMLGPRWLIGLVIGLAVLALGAWAFSQPYAAVGFFLLAIFLAYVSVSRGQREAAAFYTSLGVRDALDADAKIREAEDLFRKIGSLELAIASAEASAAELPNAEELRERLDAYDTMRQELTHAEGALAALPTPEELAERRRPLGSEISRIEDELKSLPGGDMTAEDEVHLTRELSDARLLLDSLAGEKREAEKAVAVGEASERELVELEDALAYWQAEESRLLDDEAALKQAREWLIAAGSSTHDMLAAPLGERISPRFAAVTRGRYTKVDVATNAKTLELTPVNADGRAVSFEQLSRGTRDQFLLAVRLALGEAIARDGGPVYFLDDPLLHFDVARRQEALTMLIELAATRQIILVTHDEALLAALPDAHIIPMEAPLPTAALA